MMTGRSSHPVAATLGLDLVERQLLDASRSPEFGRIAQNALHAIRELRAELREARKPWEAPKMTERSLVSDAAEAWIRDNLDSGKGREIFDRDEVIMAICHAERRLTRELSEMCGVAEHRTHGKFAATIRVTALRAVLEAYAPEVSKS